MMHITEDTPPDMLAGAMDLTVHLPNGKSVKMSVERSTPMMDVLVQITTAQHLQLSGHMIQALGTAPSSQHSDKVLPYKPNTPIGTLDTQHIRVLPKGRSLPVPKNLPPGHQPFESTFRLRVHLPRNQLYVSRVSMNVKLEDIMAEVCDEKNLDPAKYEFRHPANLDEVLDPKLTLNHYQITEIYFVSKGSARLSQAFSASDIMALRKDDERKQSKSGGVFNFFKRGKTSNGSGSLSSDNRSISPTHSDDSRSVTPPAVQQQIIKDSEKPKPPLRKRRPAPKPPQLKDEPKPETKPKKTESGLTICHSRNSSDSSGYHEASVLSDNANTSLPRRPQTMIISESEGGKLNGEHSKSTSNLTAMFSKSKSTSSLAFAGRKKKAPPPPPGLNSASSVTNLQKASPVVASPVEKPDLPTAHSKDNSNEFPIPKPRKRVYPEPKPRKPFVKIPNKTTEETSTAPETQSLSKNVEEIDVSGGNKTKNEETREISEENKSDDGEKCFVYGRNEETPVRDVDIECIEINGYDKQKIDIAKDNYAKALESIHLDLFTKPKKSTMPAVQSLGKKSGFNIGSSLLGFESENASLKSARSSEESDKNSIASKNSGSTINDLEDELSDVNENMFDITDEKKVESCNSMDELLGMHSLNKKGLFGKQQSVTSLRSVDSIPGYMGKTNMKKWNNFLDLDDISVTSGDVGQGNWVVGDSDTESIPPTPQENVTSSQIINYTTNSPPESIASSLATTLSSNIETDMIPSKENSEIIENEPEKPVIEPQVQNGIKPETASAVNKFVPIPIETPKEENDLDADWQYQLPSPPTAFRDSSPIIETITNYESTENFKSDSVVTSPELFEKLKLVKESQSEISEAPSEEEKPILNKLSLENLEKRKSLVYNRELATSFRYKDDESVSSSKTESISSKRSSVISELENVINPNGKASSLTRSTSKADKYIQSATDNSLPNFTITTYDMPKKKINIFEDDSIRSNAEIGVRPVAENPISLETQKEETEDKSVDVVDHVVPNKTEEVLTKPEEIVLRKPEVYRRPEEGVPRKSESVVIRRPEEVAPKKPEPVVLRRSEEVVFRRPVEVVPRRTEEIFKQCEEMRRVEEVSEDRNVRKSENEVFKKSEEVFKKPQEVNKYRARTYVRSNTTERRNSVGRSESFSMNNWVPSNPVKRSKSQVAINQYKEEETVEKSESNLSKSSSLFDVSGLQSLGVMRLIQNKLKTPCNSTEELEEKNEVVEKDEERPKQTQTPYVYRPPSINLGTWSDRPKSQISLKEDTDYKYNSSKFVAAESNPEVKSLRKVPSFKRDDFNVRVNGVEEINNVSIKVNGFEPISSQKSGNVVIKIGESEKPNGDNFSRRFINHTTAVGYRKPLGNINKVDRAPRPHSIAYDDISRVPKVCSVELKQPYKEMYANTSITQIYQPNDTKPHRHSQIYVTSDSSNAINKQSFAQAPIVKGFKPTNSETNMNMWNSYKTLPNKPSPKITTDLTTNQNVPFSQSILKRTESNKNVQNNNIFGEVVMRNTIKSFNNNRYSMGTLPNNVNNNTFKNNMKNEEKAPPPPLMPKITGFRQNKKIEPVENPKEQLLDAIRNFGGKKGLKTLKV